MKEIIPVFIETKKTAAYGRGQKQTATPSCGLGNALEHYTKTCWGVRTIWSEQDGWLHHSPLPPCVGGGLQIKPPPLGVDIYSIL